jgi:hypothetical protein
MGPDEALCDDVCVNTQESNEHCGMCFNACVDGEFCIEGECTVVFPPYGAPMPEPLWI